MDPSTTRNMAVSFAIDEHLVCILKQFRVAARHGDRHHHRVTFGHLDTTDLNRLGDCAPKTHRRERSEKLRNRIRDTRWISDEALTIGGRLCQMQKRGTEHTPGRVDPSDELQGEYSLERLIVE